MEMELRDRPEFRQNDLPGDTFKGDFDKAFRCICRRSVPDEIAQHQRSFIQPDPTDIARDVVFPDGMIDLMVYDKGVHIPLMLATL
jgi:hypothetical protein